MEPVENNINDRWWDDPDFDDSESGSLIKTQSFIGMSLKQIKDIFVSLCEEHGEDRIVSDFGISLLGEVDYNFIDLEPVKPHDTRAMIE